jgi:hypothetical protein
LASNSNGAGGQELEAGPFSQVLYPIWLTVDSGLATLFPPGTGENPLIHLRFRPPTPTPPDGLPHRNRTREGFIQKEFTGELFITL